MGLYSFPVFFFIVSFYLRKGCFLQLPDKKRIFTHCAADNQLFIFCCTSNWILDSCVYRLNDNWFILGNYYTSIHASF